MAAWATGNSGYAMVEYGKGANGTYTSVVIDFTVGGGPSTVILRRKCMDIILIG